MPSHNFMTLMLFDLTVRKKKFVPPWNFFESRCEGSVVPIVRYMSSLKSLFLPSEIHC